MTEERTPTSDENEDLKIISGCAAAHPEQRGGQHVARACPGVRVTHLPTGISIYVDSERSQHANRKKATLLVRHVLVIRAADDYEKWTRATLAERRAGHVLLHALVNAVGALHAAAK